MALNKMQKPMRRTLLAGVCVCALALPFLAGCAATTERANVSPELSSGLDALIDHAHPKTPVQHAVRTGVQALKNGNFNSAASQFQQALRYEPANANLHFLNGLAYHMGYQAGNSRMMELARAGYSTALKFDESNYMSACMLGQIHLTQKEYDKAREMFAYGLTYADNDPALLRGLASAAYYSHDIETSLKAAQAAYNADPDNPASVRNLAFAYAASGQDDKARKLAKNYEQQAGGNNSYWEKLHTDNMLRRLDDWRNFHLASIFPTPSSDIVDYDTSSDNDGSDDDTTTQSAPVSSVQSFPVKDNAKAVPPVKSGDVAANLPNMANVDVVILRLDEVKSQAKGINLLDSLRTTLSGTLVEFNYNSSNDSKTGASDIIANPNLTLMGLQYNLNIFNDGKNKAEILARPSLLATEGSTSKFFAGGELHVQLSSNNSDGSMVDIPIGITLSVTPKFHNKDTVEIIVHAEHSFLESRASEVGFTSFSQTTKTSVDATATMKFGETLVLSGLSERGNDQTKSSVPVLGAIPGVQYFFSRDEQQETKTSILILLTPRKPSYATGDLNWNELRSRDDMAKITTAEGQTKLANTNLNAAIGHMNDDSKLYRQFRIGDMALGFWEDDDSLFKALERTMGFLYY